MGAYVKVGRVWIKHARWALLKAAEKLNHAQHWMLAAIQQTNASSTAPTYSRKQLRALYQLENPADAPTHLTAWLAWASRSKLKPFIKLARTLRRYRNGILAAIRLGLTNARLEGLHNKIRLLCHRSYGFHTPQALIALIYLCCAGITITPPHR